VLSSNFLRTVSPTPPSNNTLSGNSFTCDVNVTIPTSVIISSPAYFVGITNPLGSNNSLSAKLYKFRYSDISDNIERTDENLFFIKNVFDLNKNYEYYINLKEKFIQMYDEYIKFFENIELVEFVKKYSNDQLYFTFGFPFEYSTVNKSFYDMFDKLLNGLMEFYIYILVEKMPNKNIIIHAGYYHTSNLVYLMETYCNYDKIYKQGTIENIHNNNHDVANCMYIDKQVFEDFYN
jgi:hypothetical protein